jgi:hypothetical protein
MIFLIGWFLFGLNPRLLAVGGPGVVEPGTAIERPVSYDRYLARRIRFGLI